MNATLGRMSYPHPTFFKFIDTIRMHEFSKKIDLFELLKSNVSNRSRKSKKAEALGIKIKKLTTDLEEIPDMSPGAFLEELAKEATLPNTGKTFWEYIFEEEKLSLPYMQSLIIFFERFFFLK